MSKLISKLVNEPISNEDVSAIPSLSSSVKTARPQIGYTIAVTSMSFLIIVSVVLCFYMLIRPKSTPMVPKMSALNTVATFDVASQTSKINTQEQQPTDNNLENIDHSHDNKIVEYIDPVQLKQKQLDTHQSISSETLDELYGDIIKGQIDISIAKLHAFPDSQKNELIDLVKKLTSRLIKVNHIQDALTLSDAAMSKYPTEPELIRTTALALINQKKYNEAASLMKNFAPSFDEHLSYYNTLAFAEMSLGHFKESIRLYRQLVNQKPQKASYWTSLAFAYERSHNLNAAFESYRHALNLTKPTSNHYDYILNKKIAIQRKMHV